MYFCRGTETFYGLHENRAGNWSERDENTIVDLTFNFRRGNNTGSILKWEVYLRV